MGSLMGMHSTVGTNPGRLDRRVVLQYKSVTRDSVGGEVISWINGATVWAAKVPVGGGRFFNAEAKQYDSTIQYFIRHRTDVKTGWRLVHADDVFEVVSVDPGEARNRFLTLGLRGVNQSVGYAERSTGTDVLILEGNDSTNVLLLEGDTESNLLLETAA